jgi:hypothetical protein
MIFDQPDFQHSSHDLHYGEDQLNDRLDNLVYHLHPKLDRQFAGVTEKDGTNGSSGSTVTRIT